MAKTPRFTNESQNRFSKLYEGLCAKHGKWAVWVDFVMLSSISISCIFDDEHAEERKQTLMQITKKYDAKELDTLSEMFAETARALEDDSGQDFLGEMFMRLGLSDEHNGQFFTPYHICHFMAEICYGEDLKEKAEESGWVTVNEPTCGSGAMLIAFANVCRQKGLNYQTSVLFVAQDIDPIVGCMCYLQMSLLGCPGYVVIGDSLTNPLISIDGRGLIPLPSEKIWYTPFYFRREWNGRREAFGLAQLIGELLNVQNTQNVQPRLSSEMPPAANHIEWSETEFGQLTFL